jgi:hypothetical protein
MVKTRSETSRKESQLKVLARCPVLGIVPQKKCKGTKGHEAHPCNEKITELPNYYLNQPPVKRRGNLYPFTTSGFEIVPTGRYEYETVG